VKHRDIVQDTRADAVGTFANNWRMKLLQTSASAASNNICFIRVQLKPVGPHRAGAASMPDDKRCINSSSSAGRLEP
jgi:hypothetical protein